MARMSDAAWLIAVAAAALLGGCAASEKAGPSFPEVSSTAAVCSGNFRAFGEAASQTQIRSGTHRRSDDEQRDVFAGVIGARRGWIVAVIGGQDQEIVRLEARQEPVEPHVESLEVLRVPHRVVPMAVDGIEVDEIREDEALRGRGERRLDLVHAVVVRLRVHGAGDASAGEEVLDLADRMHRPSAVRQAIEQGRCERCQREVAPVRGPLERSGVSDERPRNHASDAEPDRRELVGNLTDPVLFLDRDDLLVRGNLEDAVG